MLAIHRQKKSVVMFPHFGIPPTLSSVPSNDDELYETKPEEFVGDVVETQMNEDPEGGEKEEYVDDEMDSGSEHPNGNDEEQPATEEYTSKEAISPQQMTQKACMFHNPTCSSIDRLGGLQEALCVVPFSFGGEAG